ncbi:UNVERIFIED_CONTAM: hypothetical protein NCL1_13172 [Trichonephila clavipes]
MRHQYEFEVAESSKLSVVICLVKQVFLVCSEMSDSAMKFCFRLGHNATETFAKLQQAYGDSVLSRVFGSLRHFHKKESQLKMNFAAEGPQFQKPLKMSLESGILCVQIVT